MGIVVEAVLQSATEVPEWWLTAITAGLAIFTALLWWSTRKLVTGAEATAMHQLRAYVGVKVETHPIMDNPRLEALIVVKNYGQTPAYDFELAYYFGPLNFPDPQLETKWTVFAGDFGKATYTLWPSADVRIAPSYLPNDQTRGEIRGGQTKRLFAIGEIRYRDAFQHRRVTRFCHFFGGEQSMKTGKMHLYGIGNQAD